jgi:hypothetical protein
MRSAPQPYMFANNCFPAASTKISPRMSIQIGCPGRVVRMVCQQRSNSGTQIPVSRPSRVSVTARSVMSVVIRSTRPSLCHLSVWQGLFQTNGIEARQRKLLKDRRGSMSRWKGTSSKGRVVTKKSCQLIDTRPRVDTSPDNSRMPWRGGRDRRPPGLLARRTGR